MDLNDKAREFTEAVKKTAEYKELKQAWVDLSGNPELKKMVESFNQMQADYYSTNRQARETRNRTAELEATYKKMALFPEVQTYTAAANKYHQLMVRLYKVINDSLRL